MKWGDLIWLTAFAVSAGLLLFPATEEALLQLVDGHRYWAGVLLFTVMGALAGAIGDRLSGRGYPSGGRLLALALGWGLHGLAAALIYWVVNAGVVMTQTVGLLPGGGFSRTGGALTGVLTSYFFTGPFFTSLFFNFGFLPTLLIIQRLILSAQAVRGQPGEGRYLNRLSEAADWPDFIRSEVSTAVFCRLPYMTLVFMLPSDLWLILGALGLAPAELLSGLGRRGKGLPVEIPIEAPAETPTEEEAEPKGG